MINKTNTNIMNNMIKDIDSLDGKIKECSENIEKLKKCFNVFENVFNNNMDKLAKHLEAHTLFDAHLTEMEKRIESYVTQQLNNSKILQAYIEKELFLSSLANEICYAQINALADSPWWKKITKKQRNLIMSKAKVETQNKYEKRIKKANEDLSNITKNIKKEE